MNMYVPCLLCDMRWSLIKRGFPPSNGRITRRNTNIAHDSMYWSANAHDEHGTSHLCCSRSHVHHDLYIYRSMFIMGEIQHVHLEHGTSDVDALNIMMIMGTLIGVTNSFVAMI